MRIGRLTVGYGFLLTLAVLWFLDGEGLLPLVLLAALIHETGHLCAARLCGARLESLSLAAAGAVMTLGGARLSYGRNAVIAASGPLASFLAAVLTAPAGLEAFAGINLVFCLFNLLPVGFLDGGRLLEAALFRALPPVAARRACIAVSCLTLFGMLVCGAWVLITTGRNFTLLVAAAVLLAEMLGS